MPLESGARLGPYEVIAPIGAGGMREVYRARDTRLGREVAIKILPGDFANDATLKIRFEREARIVSQLNHPHICTLHDVGDDYIVMELLDGESLADRLARGPLPLPEVIRYGVQLAEALGKAHREGVVHRDLKPGNVMLTKSGAKLLDFGLAKSSIVAASPLEATVQKPLTEQGTVLGTFQYMAPEQLAGEEPDPRTDIFSLGAVLYEMTTGKRAFEGKNRTSLIGAIVSGEPRAIREIQPLTPPALEHVILKCLEKGPDDRWQNASDIAEELRWISQAGSQGGAAPAIIKKRRLPEWLLWTAISGLLTVVGVLLWSFLRRSPSEQPVIEASMSMKPTGGIGFWSGPPAFSPDGKTLAFAAEDENGRRILWIRSLAASKPQPLANTEGARSPFWSPDGKFIAFVTAGKLKKIPAGGGDGDFIADDALGGAWNRDGVILYTRSGRSSLLRITSGGAPAAVLTAESVGAIGLGTPWFLPDGNHFVVHAIGAPAQRSRKPDGIWIAALDGREPPRFLTAADSHAIYVEPGWLLFVREGVLRAQRFDANTLRLSGDSSVIGPLQCYFTARSATFAASNSGILLRQEPGTIELSALQLRDRTGALVRTLDRGYFWEPRISADGRRVAVDLSEASGGGDIWILGMDGGSRSRLTFEVANETSPAWSADGQTVAYMIGRTSSSGGIVSKRADGVAEILLDLPGSAEAPTDWSPDGRYIAFNRFGSESSPGFDVLVLSLATGKTIDVAATRADESAAVFSPDGRWIAYQSNERGRSEVYVQPFPPTGAKYQISTSGGRWPRWRVPSEVAYADENGRLTTVRANTTNGFVVDTPQTLPLTIDSRGEDWWGDYDIAPDGNVLVNARVREDPAPLTLVTNWTQRLETARH